MIRAAVLAILLAACEGPTGTLDLELATAPGSTLLAAIDRLQLTLTSPAATFETRRTDSGLDLAFEIEAVESTGRIYIQGFDASDALVAVGESPPFPLAGSDGRVVIYVAPPFTILPAPHELAPARGQIAAVPVIYGAVIAGGIDASGAPSASMAIYNEYDHSIGYGADMPVRRAGVTLAANDTAGVYVLGGTDEAGSATSTLHRFQTNVAPAGSYVDLGAHPGLESVGQRAIELGADTFFVTGPQPVLLSASTITALPGLANVPPAAAPALTATGAPMAVFVRDDSAGSYTLDGVVTEVALPASEAGRAIVGGGEPGTAIVVGGATRDAYIVAFAARVATVHAEMLSVVRRSPTVVATARHLVIAGGTDEAGGAIPSADIVDASTLQRLATIPMVPRAGSVGVPLANDQVMFVGGAEPTGLVELFTPPIP